MMNPQNLKKALLASALGLLVSATSFAGELSLLNGLYRSTSSDAAIDVSEIALGGRYLTGLNNKMDIYFQGGFQLVSYSGTGSPDNSTGMNVEVGLRHNLDNFGGRIIPYIQGGVGLESGMLKEKDNKYLVPTERSGITYNGKIGFKTRLGGSFFVDLETALFNSDLFVTEKTGNAEVKKTDLFVSSHAKGVFDNATLALGMYL